MSYRPSKPLRLLGPLLLLLPWGAHAIDLGETYRLAVNHDSQLQGTQAATMAVREQLNQADAALRPTINFLANLNQNHQETNGAGGDGYGSHDYAIVLNQPLYHRDIIIQSNEVNDYITQADAQLSAAEQGLMMRVASAYFDTLAALDGLQLAQAEKRAISQQLAQTQQRFDVGLSAITDVHEAQAGYDLILAQEIAAQVALDNSREALWELINEPVTVLKGLGEQIPLLPPEPANIDHWVDRALLNNPSLNAQRADSAAKNKAVERTDAARYPTLDLKAQYRAADSGAANGNETTSAYIGLQFNAPLYTGGYTASKTQQARYQQQQADHALESTRRATMLQTRSAYLGVTAGISLVKARHQALSSAETALKATQAGYEVGTRTTVDVLNAQREHYRALSNYARSRYDYLLATLRLKQAAGILTGTDLDQVNQMLAIQTPHF